MEHVVAAAKLTGALDGEHVERFLDHADPSGVAAGIGADVARVDAGLGDVAAHAAVRDLLLDGDERRGEGARVIGRGTKDVVREALRRLGPHPRKLAELLDQAGDRCDETGHGRLSRSRAGPACPGGPCRRQCRPSARARGPCCGRWPR